MEIGMQEKTTTIFNNWDRLRQGDTEALDNIYRQHIHFLFHYGSKIISDPGTVEDCIHDLFTDLWRNRARLGETDNERAYLALALRRRLVKTLQKSQKYHSKLLPEEVPFEAELDIEGKIMAQELDQENAAKLKNAFQQLSKRQQEAIYLKYYDDMDYKDICDLMGISYQSVRNLVFSGIQSLRDLILYWLLCSILVA